MECSHRAGERSAHLAAIDAIVARWQAGEIGLHEKRELIAAENSFYHGHAAKGRSGKLVTAAVADEQPWWHDA
jgi:hypothetical protein